MPSPPETMWAPWRIPCDYAPCPAAPHRHGLWLSVFIALLALTAGAILRSVMVNLVMSPLRKQPGPLIAKLSSKWLFLIDLTSQRASYIHSLHQRYGPVVRIGPNELSFATAAAARDIYVGVTTTALDESTDKRASAVSATTSSSPSPSRATPARPAASSSASQRTFPKAEHAVAGLRLSIFSVRDEEQHRARLERIGHCYAPSVMRVSEPLMRGEVAQLLAALERWRGVPLNMLYWFRMVAFDVIGQLFGGRSFDAVKRGSPPPFVRYFDTMIGSWALEYFLPRTYKLLHHIPSVKLREFLVSGHKVYEEGAAAVNDFIARHGRSPPPPYAGLPIARLVAGNPARGIKPLPDADIINEVTAALLAGADTVGTTLAYIFYELARHPEWFAKLRAELDSVPFDQEVGVRVHGVAEKNHGDCVGGDGDSGGRDAAEAADEKKYFFPELRALQHLPVLNAIITESQRLHPIVPAKLIRQAPDGGSVVVDGVVVPARTVVSVPAYTLQRTPHVFEQRDVWDPARWLAAEAASRAAASTGAAAAVESSLAAAAEAAGARAGDLHTMRAHMNPFSRGARACIGRGIALAEMRLVLAGVARRFTRVSAADARQVEADMQMTDFFMLIPRGHRCMLVFE